MSESKWALATALVVAAPAVSGCSSGDHGDEPTVGTRPIVDLRVDNNRNGTVDLDDPTEDEGEDSWDAAHGAVFLANIDDDLGACPKGAQISDVDLAKCNDAADDVVNGDDDLLDLARIKTVPWPAVPGDAKASISVAPEAADHVRLFLREGNAFKAVPGTVELTAEDVRNGVELAIEAKDIVRDPADWDGFVELRYALKSREGGGEDVARMRVAPVLTSHHLQPAEMVYVSALSSPFEDNRSFRGDLLAAAREANVRGGVTELDVDDQWTQDFFETGYMTMPAPGGQHVIRVVYRSANIENPSNPASPLRPAGRVVFEVLRGKDVAGVQQFDMSTPEEMQSLNSFGNLETIPPFELDGVKYPFGRVLRGSTPMMHPDPSFDRMLSAQAVQPAVKVDTSWLLVGHVDETMSFIKTSTPRGWALVAADPTLARKMLEDAAMAGHGDAKLFTGEKWLDDNDNETAAEVTIADVLANTEVMAESAKAAAQVAAQIDVLKKETGITEDEIVRVPFLFWSESGYTVAYQPGTVNGIYLSDTEFGAPGPHGPVIDGQDIFARQMTDTFARFGIKVHFIEDWDTYHRLDGEVHCGSNTSRAVPEAKWWESGR